MVGGFACARCGRLYRERPEACAACGHGEVDTLTFSEFRQRRRDGAEVRTDEPAPGRGRLRTAVLVVLAVGLMIVGLAAVGMGTMAMMF